MQMSRIIATTTPAHAAMFVLTIADEIALALFFDPNSNWEPPLNPTQPKNKILERG
jgi:hypothetical protein